MSPSRFFAICLSLILPGAAQAQDQLPVVQGADHRVALVLGNSKYQHATTLANAVTDARSMKGALTGLGFQVVYGEDANRHQMLEKVDQFIDRLSADTDALVYYSGHGVQLSSANYLIPVDLDARTENDITNDGIDLQERVIAKIALQHPRFTLAIIDACRDNPFPSSKGRSLGGSRGLVPITPHASGLVIIYSAGNGETALDSLNNDDRDPNGLFTRVFLKAMHKPNIAVLEVIPKVAKEVRELASKVNHEQTPAYYSEAVGDFYFVPGAGPSPALAMPPPTQVPGAVNETPNPAAAAVDPKQAERAYWDDVKSSKNPDEHNSGVEHDHIINEPTSLLSPENGGRIVVATDIAWQRTVDGLEHHEVLGGHAPEEAVFAFRDGRAATFDTFRVLIPEQSRSNLRKFELLVSNDAPSGQFTHIGTFETQNLRLFDDSFQTFKFPATTARFFKIKLLTNHNGYDNPFEVYQFQLLGRLENK